MQALVEDEVSDMTPEDLRAIRIRIGLQPNELADLLGMPGRRDIVENLEKSRTWTIHQGHVDTLKSLEAAVEEATAELFVGRPPEVLITYPNDPVFRDYAPTLSERLRYATVHRMMIARAQESFAVEGVEIPMQCVIPAKVEAWLAETGRALDDEALQDWAVSHMGIYRIKPGLPRIGEPEP